MCTANFYFYKHWPYTRSPFLTIKKQMQTDLFLGYGGKALKQQLVNIKFEKINTCCLIFLLLHCSIASLGINTDCLIIEFLVINYTEQLVYIEHLFISEVNSQTNISYSHYIKIKSSFNKVQFIHVKTLTRTEIISGDQKKKHVYDKCSKMFFFF